MPDEPAPSTPATPAAAAVADAQPPAPTPAPAPATVPVPAEQLSALLQLQARVNQLEAEQRQRETAAAEERVRLLTEKGQAENAVKELRTQKDPDDWRTFETRSLLGGSLLGQGTYAQAESPKFGEEAPGLSHGGESPLRHDDKKERILKTGLIPVRWDRWNRPWQRDAGLAG